MAEVEFEEEPSSSDILCGPPLLGTVIETKSSKLNARYPAYDFLVIRLTRLCQ